MALERALGTLQFQLARLREALEALSTTVEEDRPKHRDVVVAADLADTVLAVRGFAEEAFAAVANCLADPAQGQRHESVLRALTTAQDCFNRFASRYQAELMSYGRHDDLASIARERGRDWARWAEVVTQELEQCRMLTEEARDAFCLSWQELVVSASRAAPSIHNTTIAKQIVQRGERTVSDLNPNREGRSP